MIGPVINFAGGYIQSLIGGAVNGSSSTTAAAGNTLSPFAQILSSLQQLEHSRVATNLATASQSATASGSPRRCRRADSAFHGLQKRFHQRRPPPLRCAEWYPLTDTVGQVALPRGVAQPRWLLSFGYGTAAMCAVNILRTWRSEDPLDGRSAGRPTVRRSSGGLITIVGISFEQQQISGSASSRSRCQP